MFFDEFKFHHERGLKTWERIGHPIDSAFFIAPFIYALYSSNIYIFLGLCFASCLIITKDEFVHTKECVALEQWLHSVLFIIHPIAFIGLWLARQKGYTQIIQVQVVVIFLFMLYQIIYWNVFKGNHNETQS